MTQWLPPFIFSSVLFSYLWLSLIPSSLWSGPQWDGISVSHPPLPQRRGSLGETDQRNKRDDKHADRLHVTDLKSTFLYPLSFKICITFCVKHGSGKIHLTKKTYILMNRFEIIHKNICTYLHLSMFKKSTGSTSVVFLTFTSKAS